MRFNTSASSEALIIQMSSSFAHLSTLVREVRLTPRGMGRSQRYFLKPAASRLTATSATWELSIAWRFFIGKISNKTRCLTVETYDTLFSALEIGI